MVDGITEKQSNNIGWWAEASKAVVDVAAHAQEKLKPEYFILGIGLTIFAGAGLLYKNCSEDRPTTCLVTREDFTSSQYLLGITFLFSMVMLLMTRYQGGSETRLRIAQTELRITQTEKDIIQLQTDLIDRIEDLNEKIRTLQDQMTQLKEQGNDNSAQIQELNDEKKTLENELKAIKAPQGRRCPPIRQTATLALGTTVF